MAKPKPNTSTPFTGRWHIESMSQSDEDFINAEERGYIEFGKGGEGEFHFGYVHGSMGCREATRDGAAGRRVDLGRQRRDGRGVRQGVGGAEGRRAARDDLLPRRRRVGLRGEEERTEC